MAFDLTLAIAHHLLIFAIFGILAAELILVRTGMTSVEIKRLTFVDLWYGLGAAAIVAVGSVRAGYAAKGWGYYQANAFFWAKIGTFVVIGLLSIYPTVRYIQWSQRVKQNDFSPPAGQVERIRKILWIEVLLFVPLLSFAAAMARGYGI